MINDKELYLEYGTDGRVVDGWPMPYSNPRKCLLVTPEELAERIKYECRHDPDAKTACDIQAMRKLSILDQMD